MPPLSISPKVELAINICLELGRENETTAQIPEFVRFVVERFPEFAGDYESASHLQRHSTGILERKLVDMLIRMVSYRCSQFNCQLASQIMVLLGYESYQIRSHRFRQKVENHLRKQRKAGGEVPPSTRAVIRRSAYNSPENSPTSTVAQYKGAIPPMSTRM